ncbi:MAG: phosphoenolpyruvate--protein phosphotransferase [Smithellaceae bacterium]|nr:phosphoenolpyruvate--protein phosphotransferase [Smithellaceae bacterium]
MEKEEGKPTFLLRGIGVSPGIVRGKAYLYDRVDEPVTLYKLTNPDLVAKEVKRLKKALRESERQLRELKNNLGFMAGAEPLYIIDVYMMILRDKAFVKGTVQNIEEALVNAEWAVKMTIDRYRAVFEKVTDHYLRGRIADIEYVGQRVIRSLAGINKPVIKDLGKGVIIIARDLSPADTAQMMMDKVLGFATDMGGKTSHTAIVTKAIGIPAVLGLETLTAVAKTNDEIIIDGTSGIVIINPDQEMLKRYEDKKRLYLDAELVTLKYARLPAITRDNHKIKISSNIEFLEEIPTAISCGAEGIGLYRTEFIYINRESPPTEEDHFQSYSRVIGQNGLAWTNIRTFDLGADKVFAEAKSPREANPQMGLRAIRFSLKEKELFITQLRAILRASAMGRTRVLFPMISSVEELREAKEILGQVKQGLVAEGVPIGDKVEVGIMIEVPSAVVMARDLAKEADFFSIGTNDLIQYLLAVDRVNEKVTYLYEPLHPAILRLLKQVVEAGHEAGIPVSICGEMAGEPLYTVILLGMELDELSMNPLAIPRIKKIIRRTSLGESKALLNEVLNYSSVAEIRKRVESFMGERFPEEFSE